MNKPMNFDRYEHWLVLPLALPGGLGALGVTASSHFDAIGLVIAAVVVIVTLVMFFINRNRYWMSIQSLEQSLRADLNRHQQQTFDEWQIEHRKTVAKACADHVAGERGRILNLLNDLAQRFDQVLYGIDGWDALKTVPNKAALLEDQIAGLIERVESLRPYLHVHRASSKEASYGIEGLETLCQKTLPIWSRQVTMAREHTEESIAALSERFDALSKRLDAAVQTSQATVGDDNGDIVELLHDSQKELSTITEALNASLQDKDRLLRAIEHLSGFTELLGKMAREVSNIARLRRRKSANWPKAALKWPKRPASCWILLCRQSRKPPILYKKSPPRPRNNRLVSVR